MNNLKKEITEFYKRNHSIQFSKNLWSDLFGHAMVGLAVGTVIVLVRGTNPMPTLLILLTVTTLWGLRIHVRRNQQSHREH